MVRVGNSETTTNQAPVPSEIKTDTSPKKTEKPKAPKPTKPKPKAAPKKVKKNPQPKPSKPKVEEKKPDVNLKKEPDKIPNPEKPKVEDKKPEVKKDVKKEETPKVEEQDDEDDEEDFTESTLPDNAAPAQSFDSKKLESLDLLFREKLNIRNQITRCYQKALKESNVSSNVTINAHIIIAEDGYINPKSVIIKDFERYDDPKEKDYRAAVDVVKKALQFCSPLRNLPEDKYEIWRELDLEFDGN